MTRHRSCGRRNARWFLGVIDTASGRRLRSLWRDDGPETLGIDDPVVLSLIHAVCTVGADTQVVFSTSIAALCFEEDVRSGMIGDIVLLLVAAEALVVDNLSDTSDTPECFEVGSFAGSHLDIVQGAAGATIANELHALACLNRFHEEPVSSRLQREQVPDLEGIGIVTVEGRYENIIVGSQPTFVVSAEFANGRWRSFHAGTAVDVLDQDFILHHRYRTP
jgi:hypothetical protein